jgi:hypothetical protein
VFDFSAAEFIDWDAGLPDGGLELLSHRYQLGELSVTIVVHSKSPDRRHAYEMLTRPLWFCVFEDERQQASLVGRVSTSGVAVRMFEVQSSPLLAGLGAAEPLFSWPEVSARHWVLLGDDSCCHIIAAETPSMRRVY